MASIQRIYFLTIRLKAFASSFQVRLESYSSQECSCTHECAIFNSRAVLSCKQSQVSVRNTTTNRWRVERKCIQHYVTSLEPGKHHVLRLICKLRSNERANGRSREQNLILFPRFVLCRFFRARWTTLDEFCFVPAIPLSVFLQLFHEHLNCKFARFIDIVSPVGPLLCKLCCQHWLFFGFAIGGCQLTQFHFVDGRIAIISSDHALSYHQLFSYEKCKTQTFPRGKETRLDFIAISLSRWR